MDAIKALSQLKCVNLHITKGENSVMYQTVEEYLTLDSWGSTLDIDADEKKKAIDTNQIWELQWYPDTPIGFYKKAFSSLESLIKYVSEEIVNGEPIDREVKGAKNV